MRTTKHGSDYQACAHHFAYAGYDDSGENYGNRMFFYRDTMYSYGHHFIIAKKVRNTEGGVQFVLFNTGTASNTTSKQQWAVRSALYQKRIDVHTDIKNFNAVNEIRAKEKSMIDAADKYSRARANHIKSDYIETIRTELDDISYLMGYYRVKSKTPDRIKNYLNFQEDIDGLLQALTKGKVNRAASIKRADTIKEQKRIKAQQKEREAEAVKLAEWKQGKHARIYTRYTEYDALRISPDGLQVQTSQGVSISTDEARRLLALIEAKKIVGAKIDEKYTVTAFNGLMKVGCHNIPIEEINEIKQKLS